VRVSDPKDGLVSRLNASSVLSVNFPGLPWLSALEDALFLSRRVCQVSRLGHEFLFSPGFPPFFLEFES